MAKARIRNLNRISEDHVLVGVRFRVIPSGDQEVTSLSVGQNVSQAKFREPRLSIQNK